MLIIQNGVSRLRPAVLHLRQIVYISASWRYASVVMMIAVGVCYDMMDTWLVVFKLIGVILQQGRIEVLLLICPALD